MSELDDALLAAALSRQPQIVPPPANPAAAPEWLQKPVYNAVSGVAKGVADIPRRAFEASNTRMQGGDYDPAPIMDAAMLATTGGMPFSMSGALGSAGGRGGIRVYHSSPHDFDRFDLSKVGTGQGAQSFGHGIYTAESPRVSGRGGMYDQEFTAKKLGKSDLNPAEGNVLSMIGEGKSDLDILRELARRGGTTFDEASAILDRVKQNKSTIYEANIKANPEEFLDWDQPIRRQPAYAKIKEHWDRKIGDPDIVAHRLGIADTSPGGRLHSAIGGLTQDQVGTANMLREAGVPGIKYLDQHSRDKFGPSMYGIGKPTPAYADTMIESLRSKLPGVDAKDTAELSDSIKYWEKFKREYANPATYNYVVNNPDYIDILKKYGLTGMLGGGAAAGMAGRDNGS